MGVYCSSIWKLRRIKLSNWDLLFFDLKMKDDLIIKLGFTIRRFKKFQRIELSNRGLLFVDLKTQEDWTNKWGFTVRQF